MVMDENVPIVTDYYDHNRLKIKGTMLRAITYYKSL